MEVAINQTVKRYDVSINQIEKKINVTVQNVAKQLYVTISNLGARGFSNYDLAVQNGFTGTSSEWLESQKNIDGGLIF